MGNERGITDGGREERMEFYDIHGVCVIAKPHGTLMDRILRRELFNVIECIPLVKGSIYFGSSGKRVSFDQESIKLVRQLARKMKLGREQIKNAPTSVEEKIEELLGLDYSFTAIKHLGKNHRC